MKVSKKIFFPLVFLPLIGFAFIGSGKVSDPILEKENNSEEDISFDLEETMDIPEDAQEELPSKEAPSVFTAPDITYSSGFKSKYSKSEFQEKLSKESNTSANFGQVIFNSDFSKSDYLNSLSAPEYLPDKPPAEGPKVAKAKAEEVLDVLGDYTMGIYSRGGRGTGWFLDYEIPKDGTYPKKWFLATNAHVIAGFNFKENPYEQPVPSKECIVGCSSNDIHFFKDLEWKGQRKVQWLRGGQYFSKINLFYVPANFFGHKYYHNEKTDEYIEDPYMKDLAILELEFRHEYWAKFITKDLYGKYGPNGTKRDKRVKFLNTPKESTHKNYFMNGFPAIDKNEKSLGYLPKNNYSEEKQKAGVMYAYQYQRFTWGLFFDNKPYLQWGRFLVVDDGLKGGSSGSLVVDEDLNAIGVMAGGISDSYISFIDPFKFQGSFTTDSDGSKKVLFPKFDMLIGSQGQLTSYKQQLEKYFPNMETGLSREWSSRK